MGIKMDVSTKKTKRMIVFMALSTGGTICVLSVIAVLCLYFMWVINSVWGIFPFTNGSAVRIIVEHLIGLAAIIEAILFGALIIMEVFFSD